MIFSDFRISVSLIENWNLIFWYISISKFFFIKEGIYIKQQIDPGVPDDSDSQKYRKSNGYWQREFSPANSIIIVDL